MLHVTATLPRIKLQNDMSNPMSEILPLTAETHLKLYPVVNNVELLLLF